MSTTITSFALLIDGIRSDNFLIEIEGDLFLVDDFTLTQCLLQPNELRFSMRKDPEENAGEPQFSTCGYLIGKNLELSLVTDNFEELSSLPTEGPKADEIRFRGIITAVSASRSGTEYIIAVEAKSHDALLIDHPNCKSYVNQTLEEIVSDIIEDYSDTISPGLNPRFADEIPYTVQYNETNYEFMQRLARRYGEWMYNDGEHLIFGELPHGETVILGYPDKDISSYNMEMKMQHAAFSSVASSYNSNDSSRKEAVEEMEKEYNNLSDILFNIIRDKFTKPTLRNLHSGGFSDSDGRFTVLDVSAKTQGRGEKAGMLVYSGTTYCSRLKIGNTLIIQDNYLHNDLAGDVSEVEQDEILITELVHFFSADETYSNNFSGIPAACDYPPYSDSDVYPVASSCRAKVTDNEDPKHLGRIKVQFDWQAQQDEEMMTPWLRISQSYAGGGKGFSFIPETGEEVMVDFEGSNAERPFVRGALFNGVDDPDGAWLPGDNQVKAIRTRNGHTIEIWDKDEGGYIRIYDNEKENYILTFSTDDKLIRLESSGNIELLARRDIIMHAGNDITVSADNNVNISAANNQNHSSGNDRNTYVGRNDMLVIEDNQFTEIGESKDEKVAHLYQLGAENIRIESEQKLMEYSTTHQLLAREKAAFSASDAIDIKAGVVRTN